MKELEQALIALAVIDKQVAEFLSSCGDEIFTDPVHRSIFNEIRSLISNNGSINPLVVAARLPESYRRVLRSSLQLALETLDSQSRIALARDYVVELAKQQIAQKLATQLGELSKQLQSQPKILEEALAEVQAAVGEALVRYSSLDGADPEFEDLREIFNRPSELIKTGIPELDSALKSTAPGDLFVIAGRTSVGKTAFAIQMAVESALVQRRVLYVSLEMRKSEMVSRFLAHIGFVSLGFFFAPRPHDANAPLTLQAYKFLKQLPIKIIDASAFSETFDTPQLAIALQTYSPDIVVIDYLHLMASAKDEGMVEALAELSRELKRLALRYRCVIVGLSQINRTAHASEADLEQIYYSSALGHAASQVLMLRPQEKDKDKSEKDNTRDIECAIVKNRNGPLVKVMTVFCPSVMRFAPRVDADKKPKQ
jgi:replicative DNA helicase